jgi:hypothetical protein
MNVYQMGQQVNMHKIKSRGQWSKGGRVWLRVARFFLVQNTKKGRNIPNDHKMYQIAIKYTKLFFARTPKIYPNRDFWFENKPSGNPGLAKNSGDKNSGLECFLLMWKILYYFIMLRIFLCSVHFPAIFVSSRQFSVSHKIV